MKLEGLHCSFEFAAPRAGVLLLTIRGNDVGELGDRPFAALQSLMGEDQRYELFIDASHTGGVALGVSGEWALWLQKNRARFSRITMLPGSRFVEITAEFVRRFAELGDLMRITTDPAAFRAALSERS